MFCLFFSRLHIYQFLRRTREPSCGLHMQKAYLFSVYVDFHLVPTARGFCFLYMAREP